MDRASTAFKLAVCAAAAHYSRAATTTVDKVAGARATQEMMLCGASGASTAAAFQPRCATTSQTFGTIEWEACCAFEESPLQSGLCRGFETSGMYCDPSFEDCNDVLSEKDTMTLNLQFNTLPEDQSCCKTCVCYGDPECVSFNNVEDLWIPCDARKEGDCRMFKDICENLTDPNGNECQWNSNSDNSRGYNIGMNGSPCTPVMDADNEISMNMFTSGNKEFKLDLILGERGVIMETRFTIRGETFNLNAQTCFDQSGTDAWSTSEAVPDSWHVVRADGEEVLWEIFDAQTHIAATLLCVRAVSGGTAGLPRINVQALSAQPSVADASSGFCSSDQIRDKVGDYDASNKLHFDCVQSEASPLQACKHLVSMGLVDNQLPECATQFCAKGNVDTASCIRSLGNGNNNNRWASWFCEAVKNNGLITNTRTCEREVRAQGWPWAVETYGTGLRDVLSASGCGSSLDEYDVANKQDCDDGISVEVQNTDGSWEAVLFIPINHPLCDNKLTVNAKQYPALFTHPIRVRQCDVRSDAKCDAVGTCSSTVGASFSVTYASSSQTLNDLLESGVLRCVPHPETGSTTYCLPGASDSSEIPELCPCPPQDERRQLERSLRT